MEELARDIFWEGIPNREELEAKIRQWLDEGADLKSIREGIYDHIMENEESFAEFLRAEGEQPREGEDEENWVGNKAMNKADELVSGLIENLPVTKENQERLLDYIQGYHDFNAYDRLLSDFLPLMTDEQIQKILKEAKRIFIPEVTKEWEENVKCELNWRGQKQKKKRR